MAKITIHGNQLEVSFSPTERYLLGRRDVSLDLDRVVDVSLVPKPKSSDLGRRVSKASLLGGLTGEYRSGSRKILVIGRSSYIRITLRHPSFDEIWVGGQSQLATAESITLALKK